VADYTVLGPMPKRSDKSLGSRYLSPDPVNPAEGDLGVPGGRIRDASPSHRCDGGAFLNAKGIGMRTFQKLMGHIRRTALHCDVSDEQLRNALEAL
jgi:hypothetical protein